MKNTKNMTNEEALDIILQYHICVEKAILKIGNVEIMKISMSMERLLHK